MIRFIIVLLSYGLLISCGSHSRNQYSRDVILCVPPFIVFMMGMIKMAKGMPLFQL